MDQAPAAAQLPSGQLWWRNSAWVINVGVLLYLRIWNLVRFSFLNWSELWQDLLNQNGSQECVTFADNFSLYEKHPATHRLNSKKGRDQETSPVKLVWQRKCTWEWVQPTLSWYFKFAAILDQRIFHSQELLDIISCVPDGPFLVWKDDSVIIPFTFDLQFVR